MQLLSIFFKKTAPRQTITTHLIGFLVIIGYHTTVIATLPPPIPFTASALNLLKAEKKRLQLLRKEVLIRLKEAREQGDLSENGAYQYAKFELGNIGRQLRDLNYKLQYGYVPVASSNSDSIEFGKTITLKSSQKILKFMLVSQYESDPAQRKLSTASPIGQAVVGKKKGDTVVVQLPAGEESYLIADVS